MGQGDAYDKAAGVVDEVWQFAKDHLLFVSVVALGVFVVLAPWEMEVVWFNRRYVTGRGCSVACYSLAYDSLCIKQLLLRGGSLHMQVLSLRGRFFRSSND
jgi:hypothetical protein